MFNLYTYMPGLNKDFFFFWRKVLKWGNLKKPWSTLYMVRPSVLGEGPGYGSQFWMGSSHTRKSNHVVWGLNFCIMGQPTWRLSFYCVDNQPINHSRLTNKSSIEFCLWRHGSAWLAGGMLCILSYIRAEKGTAWRQWKLHGWSPNLTLWNKGLSEMPWN